MVNDWERIVRDHGRLVYSAAWRVLGHDADTEDVVQEVFLEVHRLWQNRPVRSLPGLLRRLATCRALDRLRQRKTILSLEGQNVVGPDADPETQVMEQELADRLRQLVGTLPERESSVFCLRYFEDLSYQEIAEQLSIQTGAVAAALHKARGKLGSLLTGALKGE